MTNLSFYGLRKALRMPSSLVRHVGDLLVRNLLPPLLVLIRLLLLGVVVGFCPVSTLLRRLLLCFRQPLRMLFLLLFLLVHPLHMLLLLLLLLLLVLVLLFLLFLLLLLFLQVLVLLVLLLLLIRCYLRGGSCRGAGASALFRLCRGC